MLVLEAAGIVAFAYAGAAGALRARLDVFGVVVAAIVTAIGGGVLRDVLLGIHPPVGMLTAWYFVASIATALTVFFGYAVLQRLRTVVQFADAVGLAMFTVTGTAKALGAGAPWYAAASVGMINAVGGGMVVETMLRRTPTVLCKDIYALPAFGGGVVMAASAAAGLSATASTLAVVVLVVTVRMLALRFDWHLAVGKPHPGPADRKPVAPDAMADTAVMFLPPGPAPWAERTVELPRVRPAAPFRSVRDEPPRRVALGTRPPGGNVAPPGVDHPSC
ncbi:TRIC cation channel family protein [Amycolatopsis sp. SID8362]|uniref:trimeric intracellular cation channel family protein n=1 Tax=Amycolatopsis sp. SID8362 TaxID=2690346 RepID=UPI002815B23B|nr:TRIC cation channel family protein [Amycolatopsis sp. SID8362]